jgi:hypothetical protein
MLPDEHYRVANARAGEIKTLIDNHPELLSTRDKYGIAFTEFVIKRYEQGTLATITPGQYNGIRKLHEALKKAAAKLPTLAPQGNDAAPKP